MDLPSMRELATAFHGMLFTALLFVAFPAAFVELINAGGAPDARSEAKHLRRVRYLTRALADMSWLAVLTGTFLVYPWYRSIPPEGVIDLVQYPRALLKSMPGLVWWHAFGMEWKEHVAWLVPIVLTTVAHLSKHHGALVATNAEVRRTIIGLLALAFVIVVVAGLLGAFISKAAPVL
jgi:hypothetical protein